ncbi:arfaptin-2 isoform X1 [Ursus arctos]|uniref:arfaptin-2 isoform X1 n=1 Tax=Ursus arctos TaxID=9644 RepID=UPI001CF8DDD7|nr:arfaptin-2 isoform X1 [Ursus arctos]
MTDGILGKAATMEIPIHGNGEAGQLPEDDGLEQDLQQVMVSGPNLNETSIVSGGYGGSGDGLIPTGSGRHPSHSTTPAGPGDEVARGIAGEKFDIVKKWGINTYKCTKQLLSERFGRGSRTVDLELELQIELLRETKRKYESVLQLGRALTAHLYSLLQTQHALGDAFADLSQKSPELQEEFGYNAETQKLLCKNGETLLGAVNFFVSSINTLVTKTMEDTLMTVKQYEAARLEYDAYRTDLEELSLGPRDAGTRGRLESAQATFQAHRDKYEKLRGDVAIKLKFLEENKWRSAPTLKAPSEQNPCTLVWAQAQEGHLSPVSADPAGPPDQGDAQAAAALPQCRVSLLRWEPETTGADPAAVQHQAAASGSREALLARGAVSCS